MLNFLTTLRHLARQIAYVGYIFWLERRSKQALDRWQLKKLQRIVNHAYTHVPFHRQRMLNAGFHPQQLQSLADLVKIPSLSKDELRQSDFSQLLAHGYHDHNAFQESTSGSSGNRLYLYHDNDAYDIYTAISYRQYHQMGYRPWHRRSYFRWIPFTQPLVLERLGLLRRYFVPIDAEVQEQYQLLLKAQPHLICGYPSSLLPLVRRIPADDLKRINARMIELNSEHITIEERQLIEQGFGCPVYNEYSSFEAYQMAFECRYQQLHSVSENVIIEIMTNQGLPAKAGEQGEIVVTCLNNQAMPFIRYRTNDLAIASDDVCRCGRAHPIIKSLLGRRDDRIVLKNQKELSPYMLAGLPIEIPEVVEFQIHQQALDKFIVLIIPQPDIDQIAVAEFVRTHFLEVLGDSMIDLEIHFVERIDRGSTGKHRSIIVNPELLLINK
ncbi:hypothetical protein [Herpetosiphon gulosus]|uniref:Phenylacetate-coenzyme A ligase n=1 Tax=Herpetosiphon gulosus TaxID=1973496 RepID=A0ABP9X7V7_9CHLR